MNRSKRPSSSVRRLSHNYKRRQRRRKQVGETRKRLREEDEWENTEEKTENKEKLFEKIKKEHIELQEFKEDEDIEFFDEDNKAESSGLQKDRRALEDVLLHGELEKINLEVEEYPAVKAEGITDEDLIVALSGKSPNHPSSNLSDVIEPVTNGANSIMNMAYIMQQLHKKFDKHSGFSCNFESLQYIGEQKLGLKKKFFFYCEQCHYKFSIYNVPQARPSLNINQCAVAGAIVTGIGHTQLQQLCAAIDVECMSKSTYIEAHNDVAEGFQAAAKKSMISAGQEERKIAEESGNIIKGMAFTSVIADGSWLKRSYRTSGDYSSMSGAGAIIGLNTGKMLHLGVRNKYCLICIRAERASEQPKTHTCFKNWPTNKSSTSMEADVIAEGFNASVATHGLIYKNLISDGDSSVTKKIRDCGPYLHFGIFVNKVECVNHMLRNACMKLKSVTHSKGRIGAHLRRMVENSIVRIRTSVMKAAKNRQMQALSSADKRDLLRKDIINIPRHVFGDHNNCEDIGYFDDCTRKTSEKNLVPELQRTGLFIKIEEIMQRLAMHAESFLESKNNNPVETFNSVIAKMIGGKRVNFGLKGSYEARCNAAIVSFNTQQPLTSLHEVMNSMPGEVTMTFEQKQKLARDQRMVKTIAKKAPRRRFRTTSKCNKDYGPQSQKPDMNEEQFNAMLQCCTANLRNWQNDRVEIEKDTRDQAGSDYWLNLRRNFITASHFGDICKMREQTSCTRKVREILYPAELNLAALEHGKINEERARRQIEEVEGVKIEKCGLFIDPEIPYLGASPDGVIGDDGIVEIKCPYAARDLTAEEAIEANKSNLRALYAAPTDAPMKTSHKYYYQVQGQLHITRRNFCLFALWTPKGMKIERVQRNDVFWMEKMEPFLKRFYEKCLLPEIVDPRAVRNMSIREPDYILAAQKRKKINDESSQQNKKPRRVLQEIQIPQ